MGVKLLSGWLKPKEYEWLKEKSQDCVRVLEVGSYHGRSTMAFLTNPQVHVWCVDLWGTKAVGEKDYELFMRNMKPFMDRITVMRGDSHRVLDGLLADKGEGFFDLAFVDACHKYEFVYGDIKRCIRLVKPVGILCGHDYNARMWPGVVKAVDELVKGFRRVERTSLWWTAI